MNRFAGVLLGCLLMLTVPAAVQAEGTVLSIRPGQMIQSANVGLDLGMLSPFIGIDVLRMGVSASGSESDTWEDYWDGSRYVDVDEFEMDASATLMILHLGGRLGLRDTGDMRPYFFGSFFKCFPFVSAEGSETSVERQYDQYGDLVYEWRYSENYDEDELVEVAKDVLGFYGLTLGFGAEYYFSDSFSVGGEYGLRYIHISSEYSEDDGSDGDFGTWEDEMDAEASVTIGATYAALTLNFHF